MNRKEIKTYTHEISLDKNLELVIEKIISLVAIKFNQQIEFDDPLMAFPVIFKVIGDDQLVEHKKLCDGLQTHYVDVSEAHIRTIIEVGEKAIAVALEGYNKQSSCTIAAGCKNISETMNAGIKKMVGQIKQDNTQLMQITKTLYYVGLFTACAGATALATTYYLLFG